MAAVLSRKETLYSYPKCSYLGRADSNNEPTAASLHLLCKKIQERTPRVHSICSTTPNPPPPATPCIRSHISHVHVAHVQHTVLHQDPAWHTNCVHHPRGYHRIAPASTAHLLPPWKRHCLPCRCRFTPNLCTAIQPNPTQSYVRSATFENAATRRSSLLTYRRTCNDVAICNMSMQQRRHARFKCAACTMASYVSFPHIMPSVSDDRPALPASPTHPRPAGKPLYTSVAHSIISASTGVM